MICLVHSNLGKGVYLTRFMIDLRNFMSCGSSLPPPAAAVVRSKLGVQRDFPFRGCLKLSGSESSWRIARRGRGARALVSWLVWLAASWRPLQGCEWDRVCATEADGTAGLFHSLESQAGSSISAASVSPVPGRKSQISQKMGLK